MLPSSIPYRAGSYHCVLAGTSLYHVRLSVLRDLDLVDCLATLPRVPSPVLARRASQRRLAHRGHRAPSSERPCSLAFVASAWPLDSGRTLVELAAGGMGFRRGTGRSRYTAGMLRFGLTAKWYVSALVHLILVFTAVQLYSPMTMSTLTLQTLYSNYTPWSRAPAPDHPSQGRPW